MLPMYALAINKERYLIKPPTVVKWEGFNVENYIKADEIGSKSQLRSSDQPNNNNSPQVSSSTLLIIQVT